MAGRTYTCSVEIRDLISGEPLEGILVILDSENEHFEAKTDHNGSVDFIGLRSKEGALKYVDSTERYISGVNHIFNKKRRDQFFRVTLKEQIIRKPLSFYLERNALYPPPIDGLDSTQLMMALDCPYPHSKSTEFPNGLPAMQRFLITYVEYPQEARIWGDQGRVELSFNIETDGTITHVKIEKSVSPLLDSEAIALVYSMPPWTPGVICGELVRMSAKLPITFILQ